MGTLPRRSSPWATSLRKSQRVTLNQDDRCDPVRNYLKTLNSKLMMIARACGKQDVHHLEREDLAALSIEAAAMAAIPLAGTNWIPGHNG